MSKQAAGKAEMVSTTNDEGIDLSDMPEIDFSDPAIKVLPRGIYAPRPPRFSLATLRESLGLTQEEVADRMKMTQSEVSRLEKREDCRISTLDRYAKALGGALRISIGLNGGSYELEDETD